LIVAALLVVVVLLVRAAAWFVPDIFDSLGSKFTDRLFALRDDLGELRPAYDDTIIHVAIEDRSLQETGTFYLGRPEHARLVRNLAGAGVAAQLHDAIFAAPQTESGDRELIDATAQAGNVYYGMALGLVPGSRAAEPSEPGPADQAILDANRWGMSVEGDAGTLFHSTRHFLTFPQLASAARGLGYLDIVPDRDGVYRRAPLVARDGDAFLPSIPLRILCDYLGVRPEQVRVNPGREITLPGARRPGDAEAEDLRIPIDRQGRVVINFVGPWGRMNHYPFSSIYYASDDRFAMEDLSEEIEGKIAVVSWIATGSGDIGPIPADPLYPLSGIHANVMHSILTRDFLRELTSSELLLWVEIPLLALLLLAALRFSTIPFLVLATLLTLGYNITAGIAFLYWGLILDVSRPIMTMIGASLLVAAYQFHMESRARAVLRNTFESYFPPSIVGRMVSRSKQLMSAAQKRELTILFSDIKGFTTHTSKMDAGRVRELLNEYFEQMMNIVFRHQGTLDKFIGDGLMVFFGDPEPQPDHAARAVRTAVEMQQAARKLESVWAARGDMPLQIRIGINTGEVVVGNMGSSQRVSYTVLGEPVNLAQRLEAAAPVRGILISARTRELAGDAIVARRLDPIRVKGIEEAIEVYEVPVDGDSG